MGLIGAALGEYAFFDYTLAPILGFGAPTVEGSEINSYHSETYQITL